MESLKERLLKVREEIGKTNLENIGRKLGSRWSKLRDRTDRLLVKIEKIGNSVDRLELALENFNEDFYGRKNDEKKGEKMLMKLMRM